MKISVIGFTKLLENYGKTIRIPIFKKEGTVMVPFVLRSKGGREECLTKVS